jgi:hypothetical protein
MKIVNKLNVPAGLTVVALLMAVTLAGQGQPAAPPPAAQTGHPSGKLVIWGDLALFSMPTDPDNCVLTNRFKQGQKVGVRMTAHDGGTGEIENTAVLTAHVTYAGRTVDVPMRWRGAAGPAAPAPKGYLRSPVELWTGSWTVPADATTGVLTYTVTGTDRFGRMASFSPFSAEASQLTIVQ